MGERRGCRPKIQPADRLQWPSKLTGLRARSTREAARSLHARPNPRYASMTERSMRGSPRIDAGESPEELSRARVSPDGSRRTPSRRRTPGRILRRGRFASPHGDRWTGRSRRRARGIARRTTGLDGPTGTLQPCLARSLLRARTAGAAPPGFARSCPAIGGHHLPGGRSRTWRGRPRRRRLRPGRRVERGCHRTDAAVPGAGPRT